MILVSSSRFYFYPPFLRAIFAPCYTLRRKKPGAGKLFNTMQTLRFNPFGQVHKGLRALLYDTAMQLQHADFTNDAQAGHIDQRVQLVISLFESHAKIEDGQVFPMIRQFAADIVEDFEAQHQMDHEIAKHLVRCLGQLATAETDDEKLFAGHELLQQFNAFLAFNVEHMKKEETIVNEYLWKFYDDEELLQKVKEISNLVPPEENVHFSEWMLRGMATHEITGWYQCIKDDAPPQVFEMFCDMAEAVLPANRWNVVRSALARKAVSS